MPNPKTGREADAIEAAYQAHVQTLFRSRHRRERSANDKSHKRTEAE